MKIISWNVNGIRAVLKKNFGEFLAEHQPDILCLQETKISSDLTDGVQIDFPYQMFNCAEKKGYSGTAILSKIKPLRFEKIHFEDHPDEGRILLAEFENFVLFSVYVPNSQDDLRRLPYRQKWNADFLNLIKSQNKPVIICGDLNVAHTEIDLSNPSTNHFSAGFTDEERNDFSALLEGASLIDTWRNKNPETKNRYTWWSYRTKARDRNIGWRIDYFLVSESILKNVKEAEILDSVLGSDHCPVMLCI